MTRLFLIRHGPTHARAMVGWTDLPADLSDTAALARLAAHLPADAPVVSSDLIRAIATADAIQGPRPRLPHMPQLREIHFGRWEMHSAEAIETEDPERARAFWENPGEVRPPGGESWNDARARVDAAIDRLVATHRGENLVVVAHFGVILTQVQRALRAPARDVLTHRIDPLSVPEITLTDSGWQLQRTNHRP